MTDYWDSRPILVTGADGFIGSHLVEALVELGASVRAFVFYNSWNSIGWLSDVSDTVQRKIEIVSGDIRDDYCVTAAVEDREIVFHLASLIAIPYSYKAPRAFVDTNITGTLNVLQACRNSNALIRLVHTSTSEVYGTAQFVPITENHPLTGQSPYSASKIAADMLVESFHRSFGVPAVTARPFNTYGPRQTARAVIPTIVSQLISGCDELQLGEISPTRDFNFVQDTVEGFISLAECKAAEGQAINIGSGQEWSIEATAKLLMQCCGYDVPIISDEKRIRPKKSEVTRLVADPTRLQTLTTWQPQTSFSDGLLKTIDWIRANPRYFDPTVYSL